MSDKNPANLIYELNNFVNCNNIGITVHIGLCITSVSFFDVEKKIKLGKISRYNDDIETLQTVSGGFTAETEKKLNKSLCNDVSCIINQFFDNTHYLDNDISKLLLCCPTVIERIMLQERFMTENSFKLSDFGLNFGEKAQLYIIPFISAEIGGDMTAQISALPKKENTLLLSLGTDTKIAYVSEKTVCCCVPQCPFFDGLGYDNGIIAVKGAIENVWRSETSEICYSVIGDTTSKGIAPNGVLHGIKLMLDEGIIDGDGTMTDRDLLNIGEDFYLSQPAVRAAQAAKAKLFSTLKAFLNELDISEDKIEHVFISGSFTRKLDEELLYSLMFLPKFPKAKFAFTQNAAEIGMTKLLFGETDYLTVVKNAAKTQIVHDFDDEFLDAAYMASILF